jgi:Domain of unknown function (DUF4157)
MRAFDQRGLPAPAVRSDRSAGSQQTATTSPRERQLAALEDLANQDTRAQKVSQLRDQLNHSRVLQQTPRGVTQRVLTPEQQAIFDRLSSAPLRADEELLQQARALMASLSGEKGNDAADRKAVGSLMGKLREQKEAEASGKKEIKPWEWTPEMAGSAALLGSARERILAAAIPPTTSEGTPERIEADSRDKKPTTALVRVFHHELNPREAGLGLWAGLLGTLKGSDAPANSLHMLHFPNILGSEIKVPLSQHASASKASRGAPDYFVHDIRAPLVMHSEMGLMQETSASSEHEVSYKAFAGKIKRIESSLKLTDAKVAEWMLMIIMSPSIAPAAIRDEAPGLTEEDLQILFDLVTTWMVAEPVRHASSMISGIMELELIEGGRRSFEQALTGANGESPTHPMAHIGSESQGRDAEKMENTLVEESGEKLKPVNQVILKQREELKQSYGPNAKAELDELVRFYTTEVQETLGVAQRKPAHDTRLDAVPVPVRRKENGTGMPENLKTGIENLSGLSLDAVKVHYNSPEPAQLHALAYAQDTDIHVAPGQEQHLPHEAWHVVQQMQGRVRPTLQARGVDLNDDPALEKEADLMGARADRMPDGGAGRQERVAQRVAGFQSAVVQRVLDGGAFSLDQLAAIADQYGLRSWGRLFLTDPAIDRDIADNEVHLHLYPGEVETDDDEVSLAGHAVWAKRLVPGGQQSNRRPFRVRASRSGGRWTAELTEGGYEYQMDDRKKNLGLRGQLLATLPTLQDMVVDLLNEVALPPVEEELKG